MIITDEKIKVTYAMLEQNDMTRGCLIGIPADPLQPGYGLIWKDFGELKEEDFDSLETYFLSKK